MSLSGLSKVVFLSCDDFAFTGDDEARLPLPMLAMGTMLQAVGLTAILIDRQVHRDWRLQVAAHAPGALYVGVTCVSGTGFGVMLEAIAIVRASAPGAPIVCSGAYGALAHPCILRERLAEVVVLSGGASAAADLADLAGRGGGLSKSDQLARISGIAYLDTDAGQARVTDHARPLDANSLPPVDYSLLPVASYLIGTTRELPYSGGGCLASSPEHPGRALSAVRIASELAALWHTYSPGRIRLMDRGFSADPARAAEIVEALEAQDVSDLNLRTTMAAPSIIDLAQHVGLERLHGVGLSTVLVECTSGSDRLLRALGSGSTVADIRLACRLLAESGVTHLTGFVHDLPGEQDEDCDQTFALAAELAALPLNGQRHRFYQPSASCDRLEQESVPVERDEHGPTPGPRGAGAASAPVWRGRPELRRRVRARLDRLRLQYPAALAEYLPDPGLGSSPVVDRGCGLGRSPDEGSVCDASGCSAEPDRDRRSGWGTL